MHVPEKYRVINHPIPIFSSTKENGANGYFLIPHYKIDDYVFGCMISDGMNWDHITVSLKPAGKRKMKPIERCPTWEEMCFIKSIFWDDEEPVMQLHPPKSQWLNNHPYCLHLWAPQKTTIPLPPMLMVGNTSLNTTESETK